MPEIKGIDVAQKLSEMNINVPIIFLTVSEEHFLDAFDVGAFNYVLKRKPSTLRLEKIILELQKKIEDEQEDFILLTSCGEKEIIPLKEILYFESTNKIISVHYGSSTFEFYSTLGRLEEELVGKGFMRIHRSFMIAMAAVKSYTSTAVTLWNGETIPIGRSYQSKFRKTQQLQYGKEKGA